MNKNFSEETEFGLVNCLDFFKENGRSIFIFTLSGLLLGFLYFVITPPRYDAFAQIKMARFGNSNTDIENPAFLAARLSLPSTYSDEVWTTCEISAEDRTKEGLRKIVKIMPMKNVSSVVEIDLRVTAEKAKQCAAAVFELVKRHQEGLALPFVEKIQGDLARAKEELDRARSTIDKLEKSNVLSIGYLAQRDEIKYLNDRVHMLTDELKFYEINKTALATPIYAPTSPVYPKIAMNLSLGLCVGLLLGLFFSLIRRHLSLPQH